MNFIFVEQPGLFSTVQDLGRFGYRQAGISVTGAMDLYSAQIANWLVGNEATDALLEITVMGPVLVFEGEQLISLCGADLQPVVNGNPIPCWRAIKVSKGDRLSFLGLKEGARGYLAVSGGIGVPKVLGSRSTHVKAGFGGFEGRALKTGDKLPVEEFSTDRSKYIGNSCALKWQKPLKSLVRLRYVLGPHHERFSEEAMILFNAQLYKVSGNCDRMGFRLTGEALASTSAADIISEPNQVGSIQIPGDGQPILLMQDAGTTGGYGKIGTVIGADLHWIGQLKAGDYVGFEPVSVESAIGAYKMLQNELEIIREALLNVSVRPVRQFEVKLNGTTFVLDVVEVEQ